MPPHELSLSLFGLNLKLLFEDDTLKDKMRDYFHPFVKKLTPDHVFGVNSNGIFIDQKKVEGSTPRSWPLIDSLISSINALLFKEVSDFLIIHAGTVAKEGRVVFFPGESGSGKSTVVAWFLLDGWEYLGDDLVFIDLKDKTINPYPIPLRLKNPPQKFKQIIEEKPWFKQETFFFNEQSLYYLIPEKPSLGPIPLGSLKALLFPVFSSQDASGLKRLTVQDAFARLITRTISFYSHPTDAFNLVCDIVAKGVAFELAFREFNEIGDALKREPYWTSLVSQKGVHG